MQDLFVVASSCDSVSDGYVTLTHFFYFQALSFVHIK